MVIEESLKAFKEGVGAVTELAKIAENHPKMKEAGNNLAETAVIITSTINNALLPLAAVNFAFEKAREYFQKKFPDDIATRTAKIPLDQISEPKASLAGPALQGLAFCHDEPDLKELYLNLLATAMDARVSVRAHPAFVEIIRQMTSEEAKLISGIMRTANTLPIIEIRLSRNADGYISLQKHIMNLIKTDTQVPVENNSFPAMIDNWIRLGLVEVDYLTSLTESKSYAWAEARPEVVRFRRSHENSENKVTLGNGTICRSSLGEQFARAVGILK